MSEHPYLWLGTCSACGANYEVTGDDLRELYPGAEDPDDGFVQAICKCLAAFTLERTEMRIVPASAWMVLPAATGCSDCGTDHHPGLPHNQGSVLYKYTFYLGEGMAGRPPRWPTWKDAMAHCAPEVQESWTDALIERGVSVE